MKKSLCILFTIFLFSGLTLVIFEACLAPAAAQTSAQDGQSGSTERKYTLTDLVDLALRHTQFLAAQDARVEEKRLSAAQARNWPGPSTGILAGRTRQTTESGSSYELSLSQSIPLSGIPGLRGGLLDLESESLRVQRSWSEILVTVAVAQGAYEYAVNRRKAAFAENRRKRFEVIQSYLAGRVFPTPQRKAESRIVENRLKNVVADALLCQAGFKASLEGLKVYAPLDPGKYPDIEVPWLSGAQSLNEAEWLDKAHADNPGLRVQRLAVQTAGLEKALASREGLPDTAIAVSYERGRADIIGTNYGLGLSLTFPSWNRNRHGVASAEAGKLAQERQLDYQAQRIRAGLSRALVEYEAARQVVLKYPPELVGELEAQLQDADEGFRKGQVDLLTFLELDGSAAETFNRAQDAQAELASKAAELLAVTADRDALTKFESF